MTTRTLPIIAASFLLVLAACNKPADLDVTAEADVEMSMSFADFMELGEDYMCAFTDMDAYGSQSSGTVYIADNGARFRGEFSVANDDGGTTEANVIVVENTSYVWSAEMGQGFMMEIPEGQSVFDSTDASGNVGIDENAEVDFSCDRWSPEADMFTPPTTVEFMNMSEQMDAIMRQNGVGAEAMMDADAMMRGGAADVDKCAACDMIPDATTKAQCMEALGC